MTAFDRRHPWVKWLAAVALVFVLVMTAGCGGGSSEACPPPNTQTTTELNAVQEDFEAFVIELASEAKPITKAQVDVGKSFTYSVTNAYITAPYVALEVQVGYGIDGGPFGVAFDDEKQTRTYKLVYSRECAGDEFVRVSAEPVKPGVSLEPPKGAKTA